MNSLECRAVPDLVTGDDGRARCAWGGSAPDYVVYHDEEWGRPLHGDDAMYERVVLEGFQAGLSWLTILRKREAFRTAYAGFHIAEVAGFTDRDVERLLGNAGIVRSRAKIEASIRNARAALDLPEGLDTFVWRFAPEPRKKRLRAIAEVPAITAESTAMSKALRGHGFSFIGPTGAYALMQATGMVDDHLAGCHRATSAH
jgi:DNA-3-methyladenine glycosylase I